ncbi:MAG: hypothetical protein FH748_07815 [Balneolaceae bacterium]|nr:hypothetical protein [Balneolaceae bacterium]
MNTQTIYKVFAVIGVSLLLASCSQEPVEIHYASDECTHCKMMITDGRFASQMITEKGKAVKFDAIECMVEYQNNNRENTVGAKYWVNNFNNPGNWLDASQAQFIQSEKINSPMGASLLALPNTEAARKHLEAQPGKMLSWNEVKTIKLKKTRSSGH